MSILSNLPLVGRGYEPNFHVQVSGLARIVEKAVSGSDSEHALGKADLVQAPLSGVSVRLYTSNRAVTGYAADPGTKHLVQTITGYAPAYTLEAVIEGDGSRPNLSADVNLLKTSGFHVVAGETHGSFLNLYSDGCFERGMHATYSAKSPDSARLTYSANVAGLTPEEVGRTIRGFAQALEAVVNAICKAAGKSSPEKTLTLRLGEKVSRIKGRRIQPVAADEEPGEGAFAEALHPTRSDVTFNDIGGYQSVKEQLGDFLLAIKHPQEARRQGYKPSKGILLHGPPGTGKTLFGKVVAGEAGAEFIHYNASDMLHKYVGDSPKALTAAFEGAQQRADKTKKPVILFIDEIDSVFPQRGTAHDVKTELVNLFNQYMDGFESQKIPNVWVVGATNRLREMDESATRAGRFVKIEVPLPDLEARTAIFQVTKDKLEREAGTQLFDKAISCAALAESTDKFSGADIAEVMREARQKAFRQAAASGRKDIVPTNAAELEEKIAAYKQQQGGSSGGKGRIGFRT